MTVRYYYSDALSSDTEGNLVNLCDCCAENHRDLVDHAGDETYVALACELCGSVSPEPASLEAS